ncbi:MAG TPA: hypothetical protein VJN71_03430 [Nitrososphaerales archaeon]|nr:hypothetical protein [Nitrososphaerales archaeon]
MIQQSTTDNTGSKLPPPSKGPSTKGTLVTVLQFLVGALVTMGGTLFATLALNEYGRSLGIAHLSIGLLALAGGFVAWKRAPWSRSYLLAIDALTIAYSTTSETLVQVQSLLPSYASLGSLIGTVIAIIMSGVIIYLETRS